MVKNLIILALGSALINNVVLSQFLGLCPFLGVSKKIKTAVGMGTARVVFADGTERKAACIGGMCSMMNNECNLLPTTWEWSEDIDVERAEAAKERAEKQLQEEKISEETRARLEAKLYRALVRIGSAKQ